MKTKMDNKTMKKEKYLVFEHGKHEYYYKLKSI